MPKGQIQMIIITLLAIVATAATFLYLVVKPPAYLRETRSGVPFFTPPVINPMTGKPLNPDILARHYKGNGRAGSSPGVERAMHLDLQTWLQIIMFGVMFYILYVALTKDVF